MPVIKKYICHCSVLLVFLLVYFAAPAQKKLGLEADKWAVILSEGSLNEVNSLGSLTQQLVAADSLRAFRFLDSVEHSKNTGTYFFGTFFSMVKADFLYTKFAGYDKYKDRGSKELEPVKEQMMQLYADALDAVYHTEKNVLIGWVNFYSAKRMRHLGETAWAVMYSKNGVDLFEKENYPVEPPVYTDLADLLYQVREYDESIKYAKKGMAAFKNKDYETVYKKDGHKFKITALNTIGACFYNTGRNDSAAYYYQQALQMSTGKNETRLTAKVLGNMGRLLMAQNKTDSAWQLFNTDYLSHKKDSIYNEAANALQWMAKASLAAGKKTVALAEAKEAMRLLSLWPSAPYLRNTCYTLTAIYRAMGNYDSAFYYNDRYISLNETIEKEIATSSLTIARVRLDDEVNRYKIKSIDKEKQSQLLVRNAIIGAILLLSLCTLLIFNRRRLKIKLKMEKVEQEKIRMEQEVQAAREQMDMFTKNIIEKTALIEKLENEFKQRESFEEKQAMIAELSQQTILTEDEWLRFKVAFEKIHPGFFNKLKEMAADITLAEQRMAALIHIQLTTKQMASMLGISPDSVHKTRQRLRQRLGLSPETDLDGFIVRI